VFKERADAVVVCTNTFYVPFLATFFHRKVIHLVYDLFPEAMVHAGKWEEGTFKVRLIRWITQQTFKRASANVFLGNRLKAYCEGQYGVIHNSVIIPVGGDERLFCGVKGDFSAGGRVGEADVPRILYCGNFGNMHDSGTLFGSWKALVIKVGREGKEMFPWWFFHCSGPKRALVEATKMELPEELQERIVLGEGLDQERWVETMLSAEVALVTMVSGAEQVVMPSKTYSAMLAGQAILAIAPEDSDLVDTIKEADCGWWVTPGDIDGLLQVLLEITKYDQLVMMKRRNAFKYAHQHFGQNRLALNWIKLFNDSLSR